MQLIDSFLNKITMYRLTLYYLIGLVVAGVLLSTFKLLPYNPIDIVLDSLLAVIVGVIANDIFAKIFHAITNVESVFITSLIVMLIFPVSFPRNSIILAITVIAAMATKYFVTIEKRHVFNPAAVAAAGISFISDHSATWWVGTASMMPFVLVGGLLVMRKIQRGSLIVTFLIAYLILVSIAALLHNGSFSTVVTTWQISFLQSPLFFFSFVMLTEPLTSPSTQKLRHYYAILTAFLYATPQLRLFTFVFTPEMALCGGNIFSYIVSPKYRLVLPLKEKIQAAYNTMVFAFQPLGSFTFTPGQYMEWTLPHKHADSRGNRRYFSLASSPTEKELLVAVKFYQPPSSYKKALNAMQTGSTIVATQLAGDFVLPENVNTPLVFVAGGVGIAPFRSMIKYIVDKKLQSNIILFYANRTREEIAFQDVFTQAGQYGVKTIYTLTDKQSIPADWSGETGYITQTMVQQYIPDYQQRIFYLSGPQLMVESFETMLTDMNVHRSQIKLDYFPGYSEK